MSRPEDVLEEFKRSHMHEEATNVERVHFYKTDKMVNPKQEEPFRYFAGNLPVLLSAPHAVRHFRQKKIKVSDEFTGSLVYLLNQLTGCQGLVVTKLYGGDPNFDKACLYKKRLATICAREKVGMVLDIHGAARGQEFDVDLGTNHGKTLLGKTTILEILEHNFQAFGLSRVSHNHFAAAHPNTVTHFVASELGIPAVQIEINRQYRVPAQNPQGFHRLLGALAKSIRELA